MNPTPGIAQPAPGVDLPWDAWPTPNSTNPIPFRCFHTTGRRPRALVVPVAALTVGADPTRATLRVVQDGRIEQRDVRLGLRTLGAAEVRAGLSEGDEVVLRPVLADGTRVRSRLVEAQLDTAAGAAGAGEGGAAALTNMMGR